MSTYLKCIITSLLWGVLESLFYLRLNEKIILSDIIFQFSFLKKYIETPYIIDMTIKFLPYLIFQILFGTCIYKHFCSASNYYFSRCINRTKWLLREAFLLYTYVLIFLFCMLAGGVMVTVITNELIFDLESIILLLYYLIIYSLWLYLTTLLINIIAVRFNSSVAFIAIAGLEMGCIFSLVLWENVLPLQDSPFIDRNFLFLQLNPVAHLVLAWHSSFIEKLNMRINIYYQSFDLNISVVLFLLLSIIVTVVGCIVVKRKDLIIANNESGV